MWAEAAKWLDGFHEAVLTVTDATGYPASVRVDPHDYDATTGELAVSLPEVLTPVAGPANLLCHSHDEKLWNLKMIVVKGRVEGGDGSWVLASEHFDAPSRAAVDLVGAAVWTLLVSSPWLVRPSDDWSLVRL